MKITKYMNGCTIELILDKIKDYRRFGMYQVSRMINGVKKPLYRQCYSDHQLQELERNGYKIIQMDGDNDVE